MALPEPVLSDNDILMVWREYHGSSSLISNPSSKDSTKSAVLRAMAPCLARLGYGSDFDADIANSLAQKAVCFLHSYSLEVEEAH